MKNTFKILIGALLISTLLSSAKAQTLVSFSAGDAGSVVGISFANESVGFAIGVLSGKNTVFKTTDYGQTWTAVMNTTSVLKDVSCLDVNNVIVVGDSAFVSTNGGTTWSRYAHPTTSQLTSVIWVSSTSMIATGNSAISGAWYYTSTTGNGWTPQTSAVYTGAMKVGIIKGTTKTYMSCSAGIRFNWLGTTKAVPLSTIREVCFYDDTHGFCSVDGASTFANAGKTYYTADGGTNWTLCVGVPGGYITSNGSVTYVASNYYGKIYKSTDGINFTEVGGAQPMTSICGLPSGIPVVGNSQYRVYTLTRTQTITMSSFSPVTYGASDVTITASATSGLALSLSTSDNTIATIVSGKVHILKAGTVNIIANQAGNSIFSAATQVSQPLTINKAPLTATADNKSKTYGGTNPAFTVSYSGFVLGETKAAISEPVASCSGTDAGTYDITLSGGSATNYDITLVKGAFTISKASLTATADNKTKVYGDANPALSITYSGFVNGETKAAITEPTVSTAANTASNAGTYAITLSGGSATNYSLVLSNGTLTVSKAPLVITAENKTRDFGQTNPTYTMTYSGFKGSDSEISLNSLPVIMCSATKSSPAGTYDIVLQGGSDLNYSFSYVNGKLTIKPVDPIDTTDIASVSGSKTQVYPNPATDFITIIRESAEPVEARVYDLNGAQLIGVTLTGEQLDVQSLIPGVYFLNVGKETIKLIKQ